VNTAVAQMEQVVQQNASLVEEATAATESMKEQAASLLHAMSRFKLVDEPAAGPVGEDVPPGGAAHSARAVSPGAAPSPAPAAPAPIKAKAKPAPVAPSAPASAPAPATVVPIASRKPGVQGGQWEEF